MYGERESLESVARWLKCYIEAHQALQERWRADLAVNGATIYQFENQDRAFKAAVAIQEFGGYAEWLPHDTVDTTPEERLEDFRRYVVRGLRRRASNVSSKSTSAFRNIAEDYRLEVYAEVAETCKFI